MASTRGPSEDTSPAVCSRSTARAWSVLQEALHDAIVDLCEGTSYLYSASNYNAILYDALIWDLLDTGAHWLNEQTDQFPSPRLATWAHLRHKTRQQEVIVFNTHFDAASRASREYGVDQLCALMERVLRHRGGAVTQAILMGDFNTIRGSQVHRRLRESLSQLSFADTYDIAETVGQNNTLVSYHHFFGMQVMDSPLARLLWHVIFRLHPMGVESWASSPLVPCMHIDWVFVKGGYKVAYLSPVTYDEEGRYPSDHLPILVHLRL